MTGPVSPKKELRTSHAILTKALRETDVLNPETCPKKKPPPLGSLPTPIDTSADDGMPHTPSMGGWRKRQPTSPNSGTPKHFSMCADDETGSVVYASEGSGDIEGLYAFNLPLSARARDSSDPLQAAFGNFERSLERFQRQGLGSIDLAKSTPSVQLPAWDSAGGLSLQTLAGMPSPARGNCTPKAGADASEAASKCLPRESRTSSGSAKGSTAEAKRSPQEGDSPIKSGLSSSSKGKPVPSGSTSASGNRPFQLAIELPGLAGLPPVPQSAISARSGCSAEALTARGVSASAVEAGGQHAKSNVEVIRRRVSGGSETSLASTARASLTVLEHCSPRGCSASAAPSTRKEHLRKGCSGEASARCLSARSASCLQLRPESTRAASRPRTGLDLQLSARRETEALLSHRDRPVRTPATSAPEHLNLKGLPDRLGSLVERLDAGALRRGENSQSQPQLLHLPGQPQPPPPPLQQPQPLQQGAARPMQPPPRKGGLDGSAPAGVLLAAQLKQQGGESSSDQLSGSEAACNSSRSRGDCSTKASTSEDDGDMVLFAGGSAHRSETIGARQSDVISLESPAKPRLNPAGPARTEARLGSLAETGGFSTGFCQFGESSSSSSAQDDPTTPTAAGRPVGKGSHVAMSPMLEIGGSQWSPPAAGSARPCSHWTSPPAVAGVAAQQAASPPKCEQAEEGSETLWMSPADKEPARAGGRQVGYVDGKAAGGLTAAAAVPGTPEIGGSQSVQQGSPPALARPALDTSPQVSRTPEPAGASPHPPAPRKTLSQGSTPPSGSDAPEHGGSAQTPEGIAATQPSTPTAAAQGTAAAQSPGSGGRSPRGPAVPRASWLPPCPKALDQTPSAASEGGGSQAALPGTVPPVPLQLVEGQPAVENDAQATPPLSGGSSVQPEIGALAERAERLSSSSLGSCFHFWSEGVEEAPDGVKDRKSRLQPRVQPLSRCAGDAGSPSPDEAPLRERVARLEELIVPKAPGVGCKRPPQKHESAGLQDRIAMLEKILSPSNPRFPSGAGEKQQQSQDKEKAGGEPLLEGEEVLGSGAESEGAGGAGRAGGKGKGKGKGPGPPPPPAATPKEPAAGKGKGKGPPPKAKAKAPGPSAKAKAAAKAPGPEPRKPEVRPRIPMKRLFWHSFVLDEDALQKKTIWGAIDNGDMDDFDMEELEELFGEHQARASSSNLMGSAGLRGRRGQQRIRVFEEARRRQVCVMLARLPPVEMTVEAVAEMDDVKLNKDQVELLLATAPPAEELAALRSAAAEHEHDVEAPRWDDAEAFVLRLSEVPSFALRLQVWAFENAFDERFELYHAAATEVRFACQSLRTSPRVKRLLTLALAVGNYLNAGTPRGRADGFNVEALSQMRTVKALQAGAGATLVDYVVRQCERTSPGELDGMFAESGEAVAVRRAARHKLPDLLLELTAYHAQAEGLAKRAMAADEDALGIRGMRVESRLGELVALKKLFAEAEDEYKQLCSWFQEGTFRAPRPSDEFFGVWDGFLQAVRVCLESLYDGRTQPKKSSVVRPVRPDQVKKSGTTGSITDSPMSGIELQSS